MDSDDLEAAKKAVEKFADPRVKQFYDPRQMSGHAIAESLGHPGEIAWDMYLFYPSGAVWLESPPFPDVYVHQLRDSWADQSLLYEDDLLRAKLHETMQSFFP